MFKERYYSVPVAWVRKPWFRLATPWRSWQPPSRMQHEIGRELVIPRRPEARLESATDPRDKTKAGGPAWIFTFIGIEIFCQLALLVQELAPARVFFRSASLGSSLAYLALVPSGIRRVSHLARWMGLLVIALVSLAALNPSGGTPLAVVAHWALYIAVIAPLFWVARLKLPESTLPTLLLVLWIFHTLSSAVGLLQVYFPGQFQPALATFISEKQMLMIRLSSGAWVPRPMGLTDTPGGAAGSGLFAVLLGIGVVLARPFRGAPAAGLLSMTMGLACIYLSQVRAALVMLAVCFVVLVILLSASGRLPRVFWSLFFGGIVIVLGFQLAFDLAGDTVTNRLATLVQADPTTVYKDNRGFMLEDAIVNLLPKYPLGAGLGHWGMMNIYFGTPDDRIGAEVQWVGWILDAGIPMLIAYPVAVFAASYHAMRASFVPTAGRLAAWPAVIASYDIGTLALCFSYAPFVGSAGLEFWLLNAVLMQVTRDQFRRAPAIA